eukprot:648080-Rhodomonas_salina.1
MHAARPCVRRHRRITLREDQAWRSARVGSEARIPACVRSTLCAQPEERRGVERREEKRRREGGGSERGESEEERRGRERRK